MHEFSTVRLKTSRHEHRDYNGVSHIVVRNFEDGRVRVEVMPQNVELWLPRDGDVIFLMNGRGDTTDTIRHRVRSEKEAVA